MSVHDMVVRPIWTKTCRVCSSQFQTRSNRKVTCSTACKMWSRSHPGQPRPDSHACPTCGGPVTKRAGTIYCSARCRAAAEKRRNRPIASEYQIFAECQHCGTPIPPGRKAGARYCSAACEIREYYHPDSYTLRANRQCEHCGAPLDASVRFDQRHCSPRCTVLANQVTRRARRQGLPAERFSRFKIFERDRWICHLCGEPVDPALRAKHPMSASLDHLIPFSAPGSPGHVRSNVALAHLRCNISKNGRVRPEDWAFHRRLALAG
jgi:predicted nucleic acid-binding Zn ribbon protein